MNKSIANGFASFYSIITAIGFILIALFALASLLTNPIGVLVAIVAAFFWFLACGSGAVLLAMYENSNRQTELLEMAILPKKTDTQDAEVKVEPTFSTSRK